MLLRVFKINKRLIKGSLLKNGILYKDLTIIIENKRYKMNGYICQRRHQQSFKPTVSETAKKVEKHF